MGHFTFTERCLSADERMYAKRLSPSVGRYSGLIGHMRVTLHSDNTWSRQWVLFEHGNYVDLVDFCVDRDALLEKLSEKENVLFDKGTIISAYDGLQKDATPLSSDVCGLRFDTDKYAYLMRLLMSTEEATAYFFCYKKETLDSHIRLAKLGIRFVNAAGDERFRIQDGERICIRTPNGETRTRYCRYLDNYNVEVGGTEYHVQEFSDVMRDLGCEVSPAGDAVCHAAD